MTPALANLRAAWDALALIRETVEDLAPPGSVTASEYLGPDPMQEAEALVRGDRGDCRAGASPHLSRMIVRARHPSRIPRQPRPRAPAVVDRRRAPQAADPQACAEAAERLWRDLVRRVEENRE